MKQCKKCKETYESNLFNKSSHTEDGHISICKKCTNKPKEKTDYEKLLEANEEQNVRLFDDKLTKKDCRKIIKKTKRLSMQEKNKLMMEYEAKYDVNIEKKKKEDQLSKGLLYSLGASEIINNRKARDIS